MSKKRRNHTATFKAKVALAAIKNESTMAELSKRFNINQNMITRWKKQLLENSAEIFASKAGFSTDREAEIKSLQAKIGEITMENDFLSKALE
jgi:transposase-like protein